MNTKPLYLYDINYNFIKKFETTDDAAIYLNKDREYLYHNLKYCKKFRLDNAWYILSRLSPELMEVRK
jgi:hypothetical protein